MKVWGFQEKGLISCHLFFIKWRRHSYTDFCTLKTAVLLHWDIKMGVQMWLIELGDVSGVSQVS